MNKNKFFIDISCKQQNCKREMVCGDTFLFRRLHNGMRSIVVLSDGMGHGVKANILSNITASMIVNFNYEKFGIDNMAKTILKSLPVCNVRKASYSTFSIVDIDLIKGLATIIEYDNPKRLIFRKSKKLKTIEEVISVKTPSSNQLITSTRFRISEGDRIVLMSDGVSQSGMGEKYNFGWGRDNVERYVNDIISDNIYITSEKLATNIVSESVCNDEGVTNDDVSCAVITICRAKRVLLATYPLSEKIKCFDGVVIVEDNLVTLSNVNDLLNNRESYHNREGKAYRIVETLLENDEINIVTSKQHNEGYDLKDNILLSIINCLETKYNKEVVTR